MNYVIINGTNSNTIPGLIIQELPLITKPKIRYESTEIDGKDGSFVDNLGYSSYIKTMKIGILKSFDVDLIAKYLSGSGQITFSNESDKYYNVKFLDQIDFGRLIILKEADIKIYTEPYKYLKDEEIIDVTITDQTSVSVANQGLEKSKPIFTLYGTEIVEILINGLSIFRLDFGTAPNNSDNNSGNSDDSNNADSSNNSDDSNSNDSNNSTINSSSEYNEYLTVNSEIEECYKDTPSNLKNRSMTGEFPILDPGENIITWTGNLTEIRVQPNSRWL